MTAVPEKAATFLGHESAFHSLFDCFAKHVAQTPLVGFPELFDAAKSGRPGVVFRRPDRKNRRVLNSKKNGCQEKIKKN